MKANITILYNGQTEEAFNFYRSIFGGDFGRLSRMSEIPDAPPMPEDQANKILFMDLPIGDNLLMGMDCPASMPPVNVGNNFMVTIDTASEEENTRLYNKLGEGGEIKIQLGHQFWGAFFGMVTDKFGITWMLSYVNQEQS
ncbi:VOC family protein [Mucilaginibacter sp.]